MNSFSLPVPMTEGLYLRWLSISLSCHKTLEESQNDEVVVRAALFPPHCPQAPSPCRDPRWPLLLSPCPRLFSAQSRGFQPIGVRSYLLLIPAREHTLVPRMSSWAAATAVCPGLHHSPPFTCASTLAAPGFFSNLQPCSCLGALALAPLPARGPLSSPFSRMLPFVNYKLALTKSIANN